ncbi:hypothetical protein FHS89_000517 [Rubricella aquisinus]|uniref:Uncharacterized protein n=1 Tax=Rubricella aquisinus TaxID=2028108 RepID=A0A840WHC7_9RHOB|nr:hypothetical protein [Rubricella aquisinus]MBB5514519.1 hypothetical protein [Rubricella aquisinus]
MTSLSKATAILATAAFAATLVPSIASAQAMGRDSASCTQLEMSVQVTGAECGTLSLAELAARKIALDN